MMDLTLFTPVTIGRCFTNIDKYKEEYWPEVFVEVPKEGDRVAAKSGIVLRVCGITHKVTDEGSPYIKVELTNSRWGGTQ